MTTVLPARNFPRAFVAMRRVRDRRLATFFRGSELPRLLTLVVMLGVLVLLMDLARDPKTWRWLAPDEQVAQVEPQPGGQPPAVDDAQPAAEGPSDEDPLERDAAREEFQAVADKAPLRGEEMPAYWRLMAWTLRQPAGDLQKRADKNVTYQDLWHQPDKWRGKLLEIPVHLQRTLTVNDPVENDLGLKSLYEAWGWNSNSQPYSYWMVLPQLPPGMPRGEKILEEATFVGYFLKLIPYEDREGKTRATPLLIGRLIWHPMPDNPLARRDEWTWTWYIAAALFVLFAVRWGLVFLGRTKPRPATEPASGDDRAVQSWLEGDDSPPSDPITDDQSPFDPDDDEAGPK
jgi:hypothetical protein